MNNKMVQLYFQSVDVATGNIIYRGTNNELYISVEETIHFMTGEGEPLSPVNSERIIIADGEPKYDPNDPFAKRLRGN
ncbi:MAG: hypothetical protein MUF42_17235 [Cytophagaceae bacterium]|jgi:hypothetical protein|nr:hypothetical protein [Cytophagaceae bacterium]